MHLFQTNGNQAYSKNEDGSPKDGPRGGSGPPNSVMKKLKERTGWDWAGNDSGWLNRIVIGYDPAGYTIIEYPDERTVTVYNPTSWYSRPYIPSVEDLRAHYFGSAYIDLSSGSTAINPSGPIVLPINPGSIPIPFPEPIPIPIFP